MIKTSQNGFEVEVHSGQISIVATTGMFLSRRSRDQDPLGCTTIVTAHDPVP